MSRKAKILTTLAVILVLVAIALTAEGSLLGLVLLLLGAIVAGVLAARSGRGEQLELGE